MADELKGYIHYDIANLATDTTVLRDGEIGIFRAASYFVLVVGDGTSQVKDLPRNISEMNFKRYGEIVDIVADAGSALSIDPADAGIHDLTLTEACTFTFTAPGVAAGVASSMTVYVRQDSTGGWVATWPASVVWPDGTAPTLTVAADEYSVLVFFSLDNGTTWEGALVGNFS